MRELLALTGRETVRVLNRSAFIDTLVWTNQKSQYFGCQNCTNVLAIRLERERERERSV